MSQKNVKSRHFTHCWYILMYSKEMNTYSNVDECKIFFQIFNFFFWKIGLLASDQFSLSRENAVNGGNTIAPSIMYDPARSTHFRWNGFHILVEHTPLYGWPAANICFSPSPQRERIIQFSKISTMQKSRPWRNLLLYSRARISRIGWTTFPRHK